MKILSGFFFVLAFFPASVFAEEAVDLEPVVVTSDVDKQGSPLITAPGSIIKKDRSSLKDRAADSLSSALGPEANLEFMGGPRSQAQLPQIRGLNAERILILEDGVRQNFQNGHNGRGFGDYSLVESLEVVKGPWSSLYGSGAMGGVFSLRRSTAADFIRRSGRSKGFELSLEGTSAAEEFGQRVTAFAQAGSFEPLVSFHHLKGGDVNLSGGERLPYSAFESRDFYSSLNYRLSRNHHLGVKTSFYRNDSVVPLNPQVDTQAPNAVGDEEISKDDFIGDYLWARAGFEIHAKPYRTQTRIRKARLSDGRADTQTVTTTGIDAWSNFRWNADDERIQSIVTLGVDCFKDQTRGRRDGGSLPSFPDGSSEQCGLYLQPTLTLFEKFHLVPGVRYDSFKNTSTTGEADNSGERTSLKTYATYEYGPEQVVFAGWGQAYNAPRIQDLYITDQHFPGNFFVPNPDLRPEKADTWEMGTKYRVRLGNGDSLSLNGTYFETRARDFISRHVDMGAGQTIFENLGRVRLQGVEASALWRKGIWGVGLSYGRVRSLDEVSGEPLEDTSPDRWIGRLEFYPGEKWVLGSDLVLAAKQDRVPTGISETPGYFTEDFYVGYMSRGYEVHARVNNAFNRTYRKHGSGINEAGRDVRLTFSWLF